MTSLGASLLVDKVNCRLKIFAPISSILILQGSPRTRQAPFDRFSVGPEIIALEPLNYSISATVDVGTVIGH